MTELEAELVVVVSSVASFSVVGCFSVINVVKPDFVLRILDKNSFYHL